MDMQKSEILAELEKEFIPSESLETIADKLKEELQERLQCSANSMIPSHLRSEPTSGAGGAGGDLLLAIDFGGSNLKFVLFQQLLNGTYSTKYMKSFAVENKYVDLKFFDRIVEQILGDVEDYLHEYQTCRSNENHRVLTVPVSVTFSFPLDTHNCVSVMGKNFHLTPLVKCTPLDKILQGAFNTSCIKLKLDKSFKFKISKNIINDSIAVHLTNKFTPSVEHDQERNISLILGTGLNSCFEVPHCTLPKFKRNPKYGDEDGTQNVIVNSELGFLGADVIRATQFDVFPTATLPMPLESITAGNALPFVLKNILEFYKIYPELTIKFNGQVFIDILECRDPKLVFNGVDVDFLRNIIKIIVRRGSIYLTAALKAVDSMIGGCEGPITVGYTGSFLAYSKFYQDQINHYSRGTISLEYMENSSLIGAAIASKI
ncbi:hexokinase KNAG_0B06640 [Huiozyma naganishii CBS 8797]|uniref:Phosphotransferase n=1 Tax=Huiozyma naganishii (strain ATCC MYA-139 / BCRC 22969 / CBS 8797 / KCTC 17520 / NBRC 10181 / NCYC 3082 / Yp74L-3) TaxID=1071383 RepID=J7R2P5_HUIN7|nr:hypothetical protein KNAG_0B06640 [Kazachstania naganishii CBS 8797]CCK69090.1 hypothetical protein KNAG_0B06640 [Kazachstania naganishii CBS 8797]